MRWLTLDAILMCDHVPGKVDMAASQSLVTVEGRSVLVETDPEGRPIKGCPNVGAAIKPCVRTLEVREGYSELLRIDGKRVCLDTVSGLTDGTPPGVVRYKVHDAGQNLVAETP
jgi:hypothetical protein